MREDQEGPAGGSIAWKPLNGGSEIPAALGELREQSGPVRKLPLGSEQEVMALKQPAALIGSETGLGIEAGEAVQGLRRALRRSGSECQTSDSLEVGDLSSARFLEELLFRSAANDSESLDATLAETRLAFARGEIRESGASKESKLSAASLLLGCANTFRVCWQGRF